MKIKACSCDESDHLRRALVEIERIATEDTKASFVDDLAQISNLAHQGLRLEPLTGDPALPVAVRTRQ